MALWWLAAGAALAAEPASETYRYRINHQWFGELGWHQVTVRREGDRMVVEHSAELAVAILSFAAFHRRSRYQEEWLGDRLIAFTGLTEDDGVPFAVTAEAVADGLIIEGPFGRVEAPASTAPSEPSLERAIERASFFDIKTGELLTAEVTAAGIEPLKIDGRVIETRKYEVTGDLEQHVWFDDIGVFAQWRLWRQGAAITLTRE
jgi:hypothetical protein